jgi:hypothetical protein
MYLVVRLLVPSIAYVLLSGPVFGQSTAGLGNLSCREMLARVLEEPAALSVVYFSWSQGFLTGINEGRMANGVEPVDLGDGAGQWQWLQDHCRQNPTLQVREAALGLVLELMARQGIN